MEPAKTAHELFDFASSITKCKPTVRGKRNYKRTLRQIIKRCNELLEDKRVKQQ